MRTGLAIAAVGLAAFVAVVVIRFDARRHGTDLPVETLYGALVARPVPAAVRDLQGGGTTWQGYQIFLRFRAPSLEEAGFASPPYEEIDCEGMAARMAIPESIDSPFEPPWSPGVGPRATCWQADEIRTEWTHLGTHRVLFDGHVVHFVGSGS